MRTIGASPINYPENRDSQSTWFVFISLQQRSKVQSVLSERRGILRKEANKPIEEQVMNITVIGAGNMGSAFVKQFVRAGHRVSVIARDVGKA